MFILLTPQQITHNMFIIQDKKSIICGFYCIAFREYMFAWKTLLDYTNLFSLNNYKKNDKKQVLSLDEEKLMKQEIIF